MFKNITAPQAALVAAGVFALALLGGAVILGNTQFIIRDIGGNGINGAPANSIAVSETGEAFIKPDTVNFTVGVSERAGTTNEAIKLANEKVAKIRDVLKGKVKEENIQTSGFSLYPEYDYRNNGRVFIGQRASQTVSVKIAGIKADASDVAGLIDELAKINNIELSGIAFSAENDSSAISAARTQAMQKAKDKAAQLASLGGVGLLTPISISESSGGYAAPIYYNRDVATAGAEDGGKTTQIAPGQLKVTISVNVVYAIE